MHCIFLIYITHIFLALFLASGLFCTAVTAQEGRTSHNELFQKNHLVLNDLSFIVLLYAQYDQFQILVMHVIGAFVCF